MARVASAFRLREPVDSALGITMRARIDTVLVFVALVLLASCGKSPERDGAQRSPDAIKTPDPNDPEFKRRVQARLDQMNMEEQVREQASWFGKTGLSDSDEREIPRYLRREFGKLLSEPGSLKASDLDYLGVFSEGAETVHYWRINDGSREPKFAYMVSAPSGRELLGWGDRKPPR